VADRRAFLLRIDPEVLDAVQRWANDDLRSLNGQIEFLLRRALEETGRGPARSLGPRRPRGLRPAARHEDERRMEE
jgi:hypothetical protein